MSLLLLAYLYVRRRKSKLRLQLFQQRRNEGDSFFDVCVVGAGPAGATCAWHLGTSRSGLKVLLLDKAHLPRDKICGDVLSPQVQRQLWLMQILQDIIAEGSGRWVRRTSEPLAIAVAACSQWMLTAVAHTQISTAGFVGPRGGSFIADIMGLSGDPSSHELNNGSWSSWREDLLVVQRILLDERIANAAAACTGVQLASNRLVTVRACRTACGASTTSGLTTMGTAVAVLALALAIWRSTLSTASSLATGR
mgnify:FL=1